jgi:hypothetical protein
MIPECAWGAPFLLLSHAFMSPRQLDLTASQSFPRLTPIKISLRAGRHIPKRKASLIQINLQRDAFSLVHGLNVFQNVQFSENYYLRIKTVFSIIYL